MRAIAALTVLFFAGCAAGPADRNAEPNMIQRAKVLSKNPLSITAEHSEWGRPIAFRYADEHCASMQKAAVYMGSSRGIGSDQTSSWECR